MSEMREEQALEVRGHPQRLRAAESIATQRPGELVLLDRRGRVVPRSRVRRNERLALGAFALMELLFALSGAWGTAAFGVGMFAAVHVIVVRRWRLMREVAPLLAAYRTDDAVARLEALEPASRRGHKLALWTWFSGAAAWQRGALAEADALYTRAVGLFSQLRATWAKQTALIMGNEHAALLWARGEHPRAELATAALPEGAEETWGAHAYVRVQLLRAFHRDDPALLPDDAPLMGWARGALTREWVLPELYILAWAFDRRGDAETARWLLDEAPARMLAPPATFAAMYPRVAVWAAAHPPAEDTARGEP